MFENPFKQRMGPVRCSRTGVHPCDKYFSFLSVAQAGLELVIFLPHLLHLVDYWRAPPRPAVFFFVVIFVPRGVIFPRVLSLRKFL
jgi:hypothetical protein